MEGAAIHHAARDATPLGGERERARLEEVLNGARAERMTVVPALGVEAEAELEFSVLLDLCRPLRHRLPLLPRRQADALTGALGIAPAAAVDRLAIGAATLGLLTAAAEEAPVLVLVDDTQWLALHIAEGKRNKEVAGAVFLSHKTVDFHLRRIYRKLNVRSRGELVRHFASAA